MIGEDCGIESECPNCRCGKSEGDSAKMSRTNRGFKQEPIDEEKEEEVDYDSACCCSWSR